MPFFSCLWSLSSSSSARLLGPPIILPLGRGPILQVARLFSRNLVRRLHSTVPSSISRSWTTTEKKSPAHPKESPPQESPRLEPPRLEPPQEPPPQEDLPPNKQEPPPQEDLLPISTRRGSRHVLITRCLRRIRGHPIFLHHLLH